jgi:hypothetical protein
MSMARNSKPCKQSVSARPKCDAATWLMLYEQQTPRGEAQVGSNPQRRQGIESSGWFFCEWAGKDGHHPWLVQMSALPVSLMGLIVLALLSNRFDGTEWSESAVSMICSISVGAARS